MKSELFKLFNIVCNCPRQQYSEVYLKYNASDSLPIVPIGWIGWKLLAYPQFQVQALVVT